jgi:hypothetical protein
MTVSYDSRFVPAHDIAFHGQVLLMNEAPGPDEAASGVPLYGQQGANLFHALRAAGIVWAADYGKFTWPKNDRILYDVRQRQKRSFLATRANYITCTNAFPYWPQPNNNINNFCPPLKEDVCGIGNIERIKREILASHSMLLICGCYAYIACTGEELCNPAKREYTELTQDEIKNTNTRLNSNFKKGWYMGHTRRWSINRHKSSLLLRELARTLNWPLSGQIT